MIALTYAIVSSTFSLFDFAKQMTDVSQARKGVAYSTSSGARRAGESAFLFGNFFFALMVSKKKWAKDKLLL